MAILDVKGLSFKYPKTDSYALKDISLSLEQGSFNVLAGATGSGKTTLLRLLKRELAPLGDISGEIVFDGKALVELTDRESAMRIGFVMQRPDQQIVCDKVWHELVFGLENAGADKNHIALRAAETASYFGISDIYEQDTVTLSGGQKQLINLASVMMTDPELLILDEPTAQLDPIAASELFATVKKLCTDMGLTVLICEHRLDEVVPMADRLMILEGGRLTQNGTPREVIAHLDKGSEMLMAMPSAARIFVSLDGEGICPLSVAEGRRFISRYPKAEKRPDNKKTAYDEKALEFKNVYFRYEKSGKDILKGLSLTVNRGEILCILGANGCGKSTAVMAAAGLIRPYSGQIKVFGKRIKDYKNRTLYTRCLSMLPQDVQTCFLKNTVRQELEDSGVDTGSLPFDMTPLYDKHPYDLSGGEQQLLALAKVLGSDPKLLVLDEATKGMDVSLKRKTAQILFDLRDEGRAIVLVTHDVEFASTVADRCAMFFDGELVSCAPPQEFFANNTFYTTAACRIARGHFKNAVTCEDITALCGGGV
ncbi:MAG: ABC transporter ATP-binding protein [Ruminococcus sp.]|nr:ABC transporter ATP-binding protein [Ruminococcus sp.]